MKIYGFLILILFISCSKDDVKLNENVDYFPESYHFKNMNYPLNMILNPSLDNLVKINYDFNNKIINRVGGIFYLGAGSGAGSIFTNEIYDEVLYSDNLIQINRKTSSTNYFIHDFERKLILNNQNKIIKKITYQEGIYPYNDTIAYFYNGSGQISETFKGDLNLFNEKAKFYYNQNGNLDSIVLKKHYQNEPYYSKEKQVFSNFDNAPNPLKKLVIFEETFTRALSKNNYSKYEKFTYDGSNNLLNSEFRNWILQYDNSGNVNFNLN